MMRLSATGSLLPVQIMALVLLANGIGLPFLNDSLGGFPLPFFRRRYQAAL